MGLKNIAVVGGAGYAGIELVRFILGHPGFRLVAVTSDNDAGKPLSSLYPSLLGKTDLKFSEHAAIEKLDDIDGVFLAVPHTVSMSMTAGLLARGISVFDLSADFRLKDADVYEKWYGLKHTAPNLLPIAIYGLPEINRVLLQQKCTELAMKGASPENPVLVACPGCYPTASVLAIAPALVIDAAIEAPIIINALSGVSGAGRVVKPEYLFCKVYENANAYGVAAHRHTPEIAQVFTWQTGRPVQVVFTPHLIPMKRGMLSTVTLQIKEEIKASILEAVYQKVYGNEPFVKFLPYGTMPQTASVTGTNNAHVGIKLDESTNTLIACCAIDNLGKGAASQAIQCANIIFGYDETVGLTAIPGVV